MKQQIQYNNEFEEQKQIFIEMQNRQSTTNFNNKIFQQDFHQFICVMYTYNENLTHEKCIKF